MKEIKNIIFDLGGVIVDLDIRSSMTAFAQLGLVPKNITPEQLSVSGIPKDWEMYELMKHMDLGEMDEAGFVATLLPHCLPGTTAQQLIDAYNKLIVLPRHRLEMLARLHKRYKLFLLSNLGDIHWAETKRQAQQFGMRFEDYFDRVFLSFELHMVKPDAAIYRHLLETTGIDPQETLYIDDLPNNIAAGEALGLLARKVNCNGLDAEIQQIIPDEA